MKKSYVSFREAAKPVSPDKKTDKKVINEHRIDFETCPYCGSPMRLTLVQDRSATARYSGYYRSSFESVQFTCGFCRSKSPAISLTPQIIDEEKVKERIIKEYIDCDCDEDEEEENDDE